MRRDKIDGTFQSADNKPKSKSPQQAIQSLMRLCARSERSTGDALRLMQRWGVAEGERHAILQRLLDERYIDNRRYAEAYAREKSRLAGWGERKIAIHLRQKGIESNIINEVIASLDTTAQHERLDGKLRRKTNNTKAANDYELRGKLLRYALGLGYDYDTSKEAVTRIMGCDE